MKETQEEQFISLEHEGSPLLLCSLFHKMIGSSSSPIGEETQDKALLGKPALLNSPFRDNNDLSPNASEERSMFYVDIVGRYLATEKLKVIGNFLNPIIFLCLAHD